MPRLTIELTEQNEAKVQEAIDRRCTFVITGGAVADSSGEPVRLKEVRVEFAPPVMGHTGLVNLEGD